MKSVERKTVVITAVGSMVGHTVVQSLQGRRDRLRLVGLNSRADASSNFNCDKIWLTPVTADHQAHLARLMQVIQTEAADLVIPGRDEDILVLASLREQQPELAPHLLVGSLAAARIMDSKLESAKFAQMNGLPFAQTVATDTPEACTEAQALIERYGFPLIAKPVAGNGSRGVLILLENGQLDRILSRPAYVIQPMIDPPAELSPDLSDGVPLFWSVPEKRLFAVRGLIGLNGDLSPCFGYAMNMAFGSADRMESISNTDLIRIGERFGQALSNLGWRGPFNIQCKLGPTGGFVPIEINGRFGGGTAGRRHFGYDEVAWAINQWLLGDFVPLDPPDATRSELVIRHLDDFALPAEAMAELTATGQWQAPITSS